jgi:UDP-glucose:(heptosyl)LPS alpha-1,3-glucosyltransferase
MKVAMIRKRYTDFGGAERYTAALARYLVTAGHEVHIFANEWNAEKGGWGDDGIFFHRVPILKGLSVLEVISFAINVRRLLKRNRFDLIHSFERTLCQDVYRAGDGCHREWLIQRKKIDQWPKRILNRLNPLHVTLLAIEKKIFSEGASRMIIANSERGKREIMHHYGVPPEKIKVLYNPVDAGRYTVNNPEESRILLRESLAIPLTDKVLIFVGSGFRRKGLRAAMEALSELDSTIRLIVVGKDRVRPYRKLARKLRIERRVYFTGPVVYTEQYYNASDLFVFPTIYEPFSNVCLEAMAAGLPVVTSRINGASEVITDHRNGFIVENPLDSREIAKNIRKGLAMDRSSVRELNAGLLAGFSWKGHMETVLRIYEDLAGGNDRHA